MVVEIEKMNAQLLKRNRIYWAQLSETMSVPISTTPGPSGSISLSPPPPPLPLEPPM
jgi:hypothetical protein